MSEYILPFYTSLISNRDFYDVYSKIFLDDGYKVSPRDRSYWTEYFEGNFDPSKPVTGIAWQEAMLYCALKAQRLPTTFELSQIYKIEGHESMGIREWTITPYYSEYPLEPSKWVRVNEEQWSRRMEYAIASRAHVNTDEDSVGLNLDSGFIDRLAITGTGESMYIRNENVGFRCINGVI